MNRDRLDGLGSLLAILAFFALVDFLGRACNVPTDDPCAGPNRSPYACYER